MVEIYGTSMEHRQIYGKPMENLLKTYGKPMENLWKTYGKYGQIDGTSKLNGK